MPKLLLCSVVRWCFLRLNPIARISATNIMGQEVEKKSLGEERIRIDLSKAHVGDVNIAKERIAGLINLVNSVEQKGSEHGRLKAMAMTELENASMWITKALTYEI